MKIAPPRFFVKFTRDVEGMSRASLAQSGQGGEALRPVEQISKTKSVNLGLTSV